ncbi:hypothetical protein ZRA01_37970 [Zoogloea ramigera]|uniref:CRISPR system Cms protein Csm2 n=1 Tax=Zoogloea ramigera TaxID=350 RepID=A0A4Y4D1W6_ZOORA|nr:type III-A CRISPR-associated protein Csm2 [Zoogloea ramigera]GEC97724.1 hypothetical protein ZRA01_37970 [Zoogloea ramigera]
MTYDRRPPSGGPRGSDRPAPAPAVSIDTAPVKLGADMPELLFADIAQDAARTIAAAGAGKTNKSSQLRKFYDELVMWHDKLAFEKTADARAAKYRELAPFIKMMNAKAAYAKGRGHVDQNFEQLFSHLIRQIACPATLKNAKLFMEAVLGFLKAEEK